MHIETKTVARARPRRKSPGELLVDALRHLAQGRATVLRHAERNWASITFAGARHTLALEFCGQEAIAAGEDFIAVLPEHEFAIPGQLVADAAITEVEHTASPPRMLVTCELLLLEEV